MYIFYTHHRDATGAIVLTELKLSSSMHNWLINWHSAEAVIFSVLKPILKTPPVAKRSYDETTKVWSYFDNYGKQVIDKAVEVVTPIGVLTSVEVEDLAWLAQQARFDVSKKRVTQRPEDFFYQHAAGSRVVATKESVTPKLAKLLGCEVAMLAQSTQNDLKKLYRQAALRLHPDRNNGDGSAMSELNMLWSVWNG